MRRVKAVAFDFDGTLLQSMENHVAAYRHVFHPLGVTIEPRDIFLREGQRAEEVIFSILEDRGLEADRTIAARLGKEKGVFFRSLPEPAWYPGGKELIEGLAADDYRLCLVTGTTRENVEHIIGREIDVFEHVVTAGDVTHAKPHPEPYTKAFKALSVDAAHAFVVENAPLGVRSGKAAGARVVAVTTTLGAPDLADADVVVGGLPEVRRVIEDGEAQ